MTRAKRSVRLPVVLTEAEVKRLLAPMHGMKWLMASLLYGTGLRQRECLMLRVKDIEFAYRQILVRDGKGSKDRVVPLPELVIQRLHPDGAGAPWPFRCLHNDDLHARDGQRRARCTEPAGPDFERLASLGKSRIRTIPEQMPREKRHGYHSPRPH
jgi:integrase